MTEGKIKRGEKAGCEKEGEAIKVWLFDKTLIGLYERRCKHTLKWSIRELRRE